MRPPRLDTRTVVARFGQRNEGGQGGMQQPAQPDALPETALPDAVHAVVPVAAAHQRKAMAPEFEAVVQRASAVFIEACGLSRDVWLEEVFGFARLQLGAA